MDYSQEPISDWWCEENVKLDLTRMGTNVRYLADHFRGAGWSENAIAGLAGNMQVESFVNPWVWEKWTTPPNIYTSRKGLGLVQWTTTSGLNPPNRMLKWCEDNGLDYRTGEAQMAYMDWEFLYGDQWRPVAVTYNNVKYPAMSYAAWSVLEAPADAMAAIFSRAYERSSGDSPLRKQYALYWYNYLKTDYPPWIPDPEDPDKPKPEPDDPDIPPPEPPDPDVPPPYTPRDYETWFLAYLAMAGRRRRSVLPE